jgi:predicted dehydrogenase
MRTAIVGCGKIADQHAEIIQRIPGCEIVGVSDHEILMAKQMQERFNVKQHFTDVKQMLEESKPDVVHITTPPRSHFDLSKTCMEAGCHIYVEKPFTMNTSEAEQLVEYAQAKKLKLTVGHNYQFTHAARSMRQLVADGFLGGPPIHMESYYCYNLGDTTYAKAVLGDKNHWVRKLPGRLLQNIISHGISKIAEFMVTSNPTVIAHGFTSPLLRSMNETDIVDELRVLIYDGDNTTAYFTFSSQLHPVLHQLRLYGKVNGLEVDDDHETLVKLNGTKYKSYLDQFLPPIMISKEYLANAYGNMKQFTKRNLYMDSGLRFLIKAFYDSIQDNAPLPISYREIVLTSRIMDSIFEQLDAQKCVPRAV